MTETTQNTQPWPAIATTALRVAFGLIWAVGAALTWMPDFANHYVGYLHNAAQGQPWWSEWWFSMWIALVTPHADVFTWLTRIAVSGTAIALIVGFGGRTLYALGALFSLLIWSTAEGFGGPYSVGVSNIGVAITYVIIFMALIGLHYRSGFIPYSLDHLIEQKWPAWQRIAEWSRSTTPPPQPPTLNPGVQIGALMGVVMLLMLLIAGLPSTLNVKTASPSTAAAAVSPLMLANKTPLTADQVYDASLPPLVDEGEEVVIDVIAEDKNIAIANGVQYTAWTFGGMVPAPTIRVREGQMVRVRFINKGTMHHSIDFHSAITPPSLDYIDINPGETLEFTFEAKVPGTYVYHCGTPPVLLHMANGMYGAMIVEPKDPLPKADRSFVIVQSEWYTQQLSGKLMGPDYNKMLEMRPDVVAFNGIAGQYADVPLQAKVGELVRVHFVNAGPSLWSAFHFIGGIFDKVYVDATQKNAQIGVSTYSVGPGEGVAFDLTFDEAGLYTFVDHSFAHLAMGAYGVLDVRNEDGSPAQREPVITRAERKQAAVTEGPYKYNAAQGKELYEGNCAVCHKSSGEGMAGAFPPLVGLSALNGNDHKEQVDAIIHGLQGKEIDGVMYGAPMPPFGAMLTDAEIADIANYERTSWGNKGKLITDKDVEALR